MGIYDGAAPLEDTRDDLRLEAVTTCVGFDDLLDVTLAQNHPHVDSLIVVTAHDDRRTQAVCAKHGCVCVQTDLFTKHARQFNKGAAINAGFAYWQYRGWRVHLDADIVLPDNFRRLLFNHTALNKDTLYGADRVNVVGTEALQAVVNRPQHLHSALLEATASQPIGARFVSPLHGYLPLGFFQLWHTRCQKDYPYSLGTAAHDDTMFSALWPRDRRQHLPTAICYQLCSRPPVWGENWDGRREQPRLR